MRSRNTNIGDGSVELRRVEIVCKALVSSTSWRSDQRPRAVTE